MPLRERRLKTGIGERWNKKQVPETEGGQRLATEREVTRNWHWREMGKETGTREREGARNLLLRERDNKLTLEREGGIN